MSQQWYNPSPRPTWPAPSPTQSGMSPSMPQLGAGQDYFDPYLSDMGAYGPMGNLPETQWGPEPSPNDYGMGQAPWGQPPPPDPWMGPQFEQGGQQPPPQQGPTGHPILDRLMSPDMADRAMAAAIFARGFVAPQEAINWAMQIRSQRQAQQARADQSKMEQAAMTERKRYEGEAKKSAQDEKYVNQAWVRATNAGVLNEVEQEMGVPWTQWTPEMAAVADKITSQRVAQHDAQKEVDKEGETKRKILNDALKRPVQASLYTDPKSKKHDPEFAAMLEGANTARKNAQRNKAEMDRALLTQRRKVAGFYGKMTDDQRTAVKQFDPEIKALSDQITTLNNALTMDFESQIDFALANNIPAQGDIKTNIQAKIDELRTERDELFNRQYKAAGGKGTSPATKSTAPTATEDGGWDEANPTPADIPKEEIDRLRQRWAAYTDPALRQLLREAFEGQFGVSVDDYIKPNE